MAKRPTTTPEQEGIEFRPDGWDRFKAAVHAAAKVPRLPPSQDGEKKLKKKTKPQKR